MDVCTITCNAIATELASFEALNDLVALNPVEIRLIGTGHDEMGTTGRAAGFELHPRDRAAAGAWRGSNARAAFARDRSSQ